LRLFKWVYYLYSNSHSTPPPHTHIPPPPLHTHSHTHTHTIHTGKTGATKKMLKLAQRTFGSLTSLNVCFVSATDQHTDEVTVDTKSMFEFLNRFPRNLIGRLVKTVETCVDNFQSVCSELKRKEQLRSVLCLLLVCGSLRNVRLEYHHLLDRVMSSLQNFPKSQSNVLARMAIEIVDAKSLSNRLVVPIVRAFDTYFRQPKTEQNVRRWINTAEFLNHLFFHNTQNRNRMMKSEFISQYGNRLSLSNESFVSRVASSMPDRALYEEYQRYLSRQNNGVFSLMKYSFLLDAASKRRVLQLEARFGMIQRGRNAIFQSMFRRTSPYFVLSVRRDAILRDTLNRINQILKSQLQQEMKKELKVVFANEEGIDEGGVKREFFQLLVEELFNPLYVFFLFLTRSLLFKFLTYSLTHVRIHSLTHLPIQVWNVEQKQNIGIVLVLFTQHTSFQLRRFE
jgi:hypothetical protein